MKFPQSMKAMELPGESMLEHVLFQKISRFTAVLGTVAVVVSMILSGRRLLDLV